MKNAYALEHNHIIVEKYKIEILYGEKKISSHNFRKFLAC